MAVRARTGKWGHSIQLARPSFHLWGAAASAPKSELEAPVLFAGLSPAHTGSTAKGSGRRFPMYPLPDSKNG